MMKTFCSLLLFCLFAISCSDDIQEELVGEWKLVKTSSDCSQSTEFNNEETFAVDGCASTTVVSNSGTSFDLGVCSILTFYESGEVDVLSGDPLQANIETLTYEIGDDDRITICTTSGFCKDYNLENGKLVRRFQIQVDGLPLEDCIRTFTYEK